MPTTAEKSSRGISNRPTSPAGAEGAAGETVLEVSEGRLATLLWSPNNWRSAWSSCLWKTQVSSAAKPQ